MRQIVRKLIITYNNYKVGKLRKIPVVLFFFKQWNINPPVHIMRLLKPDV